MPDLKTGKSLYEDELVVVTTAVHKGKEGFLFHYSNPPRHTVNMDGLASFKSGLQEIQKQRAYDSFLVMYGDFDPTHAGADVRDFDGDVQPDLAKDFMVRGIGIDFIIKELSKNLTTVGVLSGDHYGGSLEWRLMPEFRVADSRSRAQFSECLIGIVPGWNGILNAMLISGRENAEYLAKTGNPVNAQEMYDIGLVDRVVKVDFPYPNIRDFEVSSAQSYDEARRQHSDETYAAIMPAALDLAATKKEGIDGIKVKILETLEETKRIVDRRSNPNNYVGIAGRRLRECKTELSELGGRPISPDAVQALNEFFKQFGDYDRGHLLSEFESIAKIEGSMCADLMQTQNRRIGIRAVLEGVVPSFNK